MPVAFATLAFLAFAPPPIALPTARDIYQACSRYVARQEGGRSPRRATATDAEATQMVCETVAISEVMSIQVMEPRWICLPDDVLRAADSTLPLAKTYLTFFERNPAIHDSADGTTAFRRALTLRWPCRR